MRTAIDVSDEPDLYELLQVHPKADPDIIKKAYRTLMQRLHPDQGGDGTLARQVNQAYETLTDADRRAAYDARRQNRLKARLRSAVQQGKAQAQTPDCPILSGEGVLVADERNDRALILAPSGDIVWQYGGQGSGVEARLHRPRHASYTPEGHRLIVDTGANRIVEVRPNRTLHWSCDQGLSTPVFAQRLGGGTTLVAEAGAKRVVELAPDGGRVWQGSLATAPMAAWRLETGETLVADGRNLLRLSRSGKVAASLPPTGWLGRWRWRGRAWHGANFAVPLGNDGYLVTSDRIAAVDRQGHYLWQFDGLPEADIRQAYALANGQLLVDFVHLVKRGVNQEVVLLDEGRRPVWRHYYSQHRFI